MYKSVAVVVGIGFTVLAIVAKNSGIPNDITFGEMLNVFLLVNIWIAVSNDKLQS